MALTLGTARRLLKLGMAGLLLPGAAARLLLSLAGARLPLLRGMARLLLPLAALVAVSAGCTGEVGTITVALVTAPGADPLAGATVGRLTLSSPHEEVTAPLDRGVLSLDLDARDRLATVTFTAETDDGTVIARGQTPPLPLGAVDFDLAIYVAAPWSVAEAPVSFDTGRTGLAAAALFFGVVLAGGIDAGDQASSDLVIYNAYQHEFQIGDDLPAARSEMGAAADSAGGVYLVGGRDAAGDLASGATRFDTNVAPAGAYAMLTAAVPIARAAPDVVALGAQRFLVAGGPLLTIDAAAATVSPLPGGDDLDGRAASIDLGDDAEPVALVVGSQRVARVQGDTVALLDEPDVVRERHAVVAVPGGILVVGGVDAGGSDDTARADAVLYHPDDGRFEIIDDFLSVPRADVGATVTSHYVVVAGGTEADGSPSSAVEVFDRDTLEPVAQTTLATPRVSPTVAPLANGQVLIAGGRDPSGDPIATLELFTPGD